MGVHQFEPGVGGESLHVFKKPHQVEDIPVAERRIGVGQLLADRFQEMRLGRLDSADFDQVEVVLLLDAQFPHRLSSGRRAGGYPDPEQAVGELVFADQFAERFSGLPLLFFLFFRAEEPPAQRDQHDDSGQDTYQADRSERKEGQRLVARVGQYVLDNEVRGGPDQRQHTAHAACECQRHQYAADVHVRIGCETHHDREHQRDGSRIAYKGADGRSDQHDKDEQFQFAVAGQSQDAAADHFGQSGLENRAAYDEQPDHHDDDRVGESGQRLFGGQYLENEQAQQRAQRHQVGTYRPFIKRRPTVPGLRA